MFFFTPKNSSSQSLLERFPDTNVGAHYASCQLKAHTRATDKRHAVMSKLTTNKMESIEFSRAARKSIPPEVLEEIETLNWMDMELHQLAQELHTATMNKQIADGSFQV